MRAARALLGLDQKTLAELSGVSLPTIQRMEASGGNVRGIVDSLTKVIDALNRLDGHAQLLSSRLEQFEDPNFTMQPLASHLDEIYSTYVMDSQRDTHHSALGGAGPAAGKSGGGPKVELF